MLSTPTSVFMPLNSQRTSSHRTQLCRSGRIASVDSIASNRAAHQQDDQHDSQCDPINGEWRKPPRPDPAHEPGDYYQRDKERNDKTNREHDPLMRVDS